MPMLYFSIPAQQPEPAASELNHCLATRRVAQVQQQLVADGGNSFWAVAVSVIDGDARTGAAQATAGDNGRRRNSIDYRELLAADEFALYDQLRSARKQAAEADGVPTYAVFTNEQLASMVRQRMTSTAALGSLHAVGEGRLRSYGDRFLALLREGVPLLGAVPATPLPPSAANAANPAEPR